VHHREVVGVISVVVAGTAFDAGSQIDEVGDLLLDDLDPLFHRHRVVPAGRDSVVTRGG
jgi:hypothetical protein